MPSRVSLEPSLPAYSRRGAGWACKECRVCKGRAFPLLPFFLDSKPPAPLLSSTLSSALMPCLPACLPACLFVSVQAEASRVPAPEAPDDAAAEAERRAGNELFAAGQYAEAAEKYTASLRHATRCGGVHRVGVGVVPPAVSRVGRTHPSSAGQRASTCAGSAAPPSLSRLNPSLIVLALCPVPYSPCPALCALRPSSSSCPPPHAQRRRDVGEPRRLPPAAGAV